VTEVTNELMYEMLKAIRADVAVLKSILDDHSRQLIDLRKQLNTMQAETVRTDEHMLALDSRLDRIERRLQLTDAE
jgi:septal ring factor EnvC (AmiA/AmiB activator)